MTIVGRRKEQRELERLGETPRAEFVVVYGRRRVGKTYLVREYFNKEFAFHATGIARGNKALQLAGFNESLRRAGGTGDATDWMSAFSRLRDLLESGNALRDVKSGKMVIFIDEMPWLDTPRAQFLPALEYFWNIWASGQPDLLLIACGSATSWITKNLLSNHGGLHNRVTSRIHLEPLCLGECRAYYEMNGLAFSEREMLESYMVFGGVPFYLDLLDRRIGLTQNVDHLCFGNTAQLHNEFDELFRSLFRQADRHIRIVRVLASKASGMSRDELCAAAHMSDGGGLSTTLAELEQCGFIRRFGDFTKAKLGDTYQLIDSFTLFYLRFVEEGHTSGWWNANYGSPAIRAWSGYAFELVCLLHTKQILHSMDVLGVSHTASTWRSQSSDNCAQIDLVIDRADGIINLCEMKYADHPFAITKSYEQRLGLKRTVFARETKSRKALHMTLVSPLGVVNNTHRGAVQEVVTAEDLFWRP